MGYGFFLQKPEFISVVARVRDLQCRKRLGVVFLPISYASGNACISALIKLERNMIFIPAVMVLQLETEMPNFVIEWFALLLCSGDTPPPLHILAWKPTILTQISWSFVSGMKYSTDYPWVH
jgi:hypothetical protein